ncbi:hypothetical protein GCM10020331_047100 [Ectobacillus funiculus]
MRTKSCWAHLEKERQIFLLGTQMIAKGLDFSARNACRGIDGGYDAALTGFFGQVKKTYQLLTQVSGRAGRHHLPGEVVIQTYTPEHYSVELAKQQEYDVFF